MPAKETEIEGIPISQGLARTPWTVASPMVKVVLCIQPDQKQRAFSSRSAREESVVNGHQMRPKNFSYGMHDALSLSISRGALRRQ